MCGLQRSTNATASTIAGFGLDRQTQPVAVAKVSTVKTSGVVAASWA